MGDLWQEESFAGAGTAGADGDDWDEGEESLGLPLEDGFDDPDEIEEGDGWDDEDDEA
jgi:hypothetical protein